MACNLARLVFICEESVVPSSGQPTVRELLRDDVKAAAVERRRDTEAGSCEFASEPISADERIRTSTGLSPTRPST